MTKDHGYDRDTALEHAVNLAHKGRIAPESVLAVAKAYLAFLDPSVTGVETPAITVYWDEDGDDSYYRFFKGTIGYVHTPNRGLRKNSDYSEDELANGDGGYYSVPAGHKLPDAVKEAIA